MTLKGAFALIEQDSFPNQIIFNLNDDKITYSVDCIFNSIKVNGEDRSVILHSDKTNFPKDTELLMVERDEEKIWFDIIIPDEEEKENNSMNEKENKIEEVKEINPIDEYLNNYKEQKLAEFCVQKDKEIVYRREEREKFIGQIAELKQKIKEYDKRFEEYDRTHNNVRKLYWDVIKELSVKDYLELYHMILNDIFGNSNLATATTIGTSSACYLGTVYDR